MIKTELIYGIYDISDDINSFIAKHTGSNPTFKLIDIKYQAFGSGTNNYSTSHNALIIYEEEATDDGNDN